MTADRPATEPRTAAGRTLYDVTEHMEWTSGMAVGNRYMLDAILAIEAEAAQGAAPRAEGPPPELFAELWEVVDRLDRSIVRRLITEAWPVAAPLHVAKPKCLRCGASWVHRDDYAGLGTPHPYEPSEEAAPLVATNATDTPEQVRASGWKRVGAAPLDHDCVMPSACGVTGFYCYNSREGAAPRAEGRWRAFFDNYDLGTMFIATSENPDDLLVDNLPGEVATTIVDAHNGEAAPRAEGLDRNLLAEAIFESGVRQTMSQSEQAADNILAELAILLSRPSDERGG